MTLKSRASSIDKRQLGEIRTMMQTAAPTGTDKRILPAFLLCFFLGWTGAHRYYVGKIGTGILMLLTGGVFGILWLIDFIMIIVGAFTDKAGNKITEWT
jgi:TM2 domain-containing membrane protein YozV